MSIESEIRRVNNPAVKVLYGTDSLVPAPLITWSVEPQFDDSGNRTSDINRLTLTGTILVIPSGSYEQMYTKQANLRSVFSVDRLDFLILAGPGNATLAENAIISSGLQPRINSITIDPGVQVDRIDYTIELEDTVSVSGVSGITSSLSNQWQFIEDNNSCTLQVTHTVSAEGPDGEPDKFEQALRAVIPLLGISQLPLQLPYFTEPNFSGLWGMTHPTNPSGGPVFEISVSREETADVVNGTYSVKEIFTIVSGVPFFYTSKTASFDTDTNGISNVTVAGTVQGLGRTLSTTHDVGGVGFDRACSGFLYQIKPRIPTEASGIYLKYNQSALPELQIGKPTSTSISENRCNGTISFSYSFTNDPLAALPSGIAELSSSSNIVEGVKLTVSHAIPFRRLGNLLQTMFTTTEGTISLQAQARAINTGDLTVDINRAIEAIQDELNELREKHANTADYITIRLANQNQNINEKTLTCSATVDYTFTKDFNAVPTAESAITLRMLS